MGGVNFIVQASSTSWAGGPDLCMNGLDGLPTVYWTVKRIFDHRPDAKVVIAAPEFDRGGRLEALRERFIPYDLRIYYGYDASPLDRFLQVAAEWPDEESFVRVDGIHCFFDVDKALTMLQLARSEGLDCVKFPDDYPVQFTADVYKIGALKRVKQLLASEPSDASGYVVHPKFYMFHRRDAFTCRYLEHLPTYTDDYLRQCRAKATAIYLPRETSHERHRFVAGDGLGFRYEFAARFLDSARKLLDIACGTGFGTVLLSQFVEEAHGADIDDATVQQACEHQDHHDNVRFHVEDATCLSFQSESFDVVVSIETIEHLDARRFLREAHRVLKPHGRLILSTPQNCLGHIPINAQHLREYSLEELVALCSDYFAIEKAIGQKAGRIWFEDDPKGNTTLLVCRKA